MRQFSKPIRGMIQLIVIVLSVCAVGAYAQEVPLPAESNSIQSISAGNEAGGKIVITVSLKAPPEKLPIHRHALPSIFQTPRMLLGNRYKNSARVICAVPILFRREIAHVW